MIFSISGIGAWGPGFTDWPQLSALMRGEQDSAATAEAPKPEVIPSNERRRAPLSAKLAVEVCSQATAHYPTSERQMSCVFASGLGDTELTEYMCRELAGENKQLSPTKFHNSVHNAPAGYWTIATGCSRPASAVAGLYRSVSQGLLEALVQCQTESGPVLLAVYDTPATPTLSGLYPCESLFAAALVIAPSTPDVCEATLQWAVEPGEDTEWPEFFLPDLLKNCYETNIAARLLAVLAPVSQGKSATLKLPLSVGTCLSLRVTPQPKS